MILDIDQKDHQLDVSYLDKAGNKCVMSFPIQNYSQWQIDPTGIGTPGYRDVSGKPVVQKWAHSFRTFDLLSFFKALPKETRDELFAYREANLIASDIETEIGDRFPKPELAEMPVNAISCVDTQMNIVIYTTKQCQGQITVYDKVEAEPNEDGASEEVQMMSLTEIAQLDQAYAERIVAEQLAGVYDEDKYDVMLKPSYDGTEDDDEVDDDEPEEEVQQEEEKKPVDSMKYPYHTGKWFRRVPRVTTVVDEVNKIIREQVGHLIAPHEKIDAKILQFDTEKQMLEAYFGNIVKFAAVLSFWNGDGFDKPYLFNRCLKNGIPTNIGSITGEIATMTNTPKHTIFTDYMFMVDKYDRRIKNRESLKLDYISFRLFNKGKLPYRGTLKELSENDIPGFLAYNAIDSILVQLIHRNLNLMATLYGFSQVCRIPLAKAKSQVAQTEALISLDTLDMLDTEGIQLPEKPKFDHIQVAAFDPNRPPRRKYDGGHVKEPHKHVSQWDACIDFSGLYPSCHRSCNLSVENYLGPISQYNEATQAAILQNKNYFVSVNNNVYRNDRAYAYKRIQIYLRAKRDYHKERMNKHLSLQQPFIERALHERGVWNENPIVDESITTLPWTVYIEDNKYEPDLAHLNNPGDQDGYEHHLNFIWFLFHENLRQGFFEMNMQVAFKLVSNSLYGATANEFNSFRNCEVADDTTAEGRNSIVAAEKIINNFFNFEWPHDYAAHKFLLDAFPGKFTKLVEGEMPPMAIKDRIMYIDTDSLYIEYIDLIENTGFTGDNIDIFVALYDGYKVKNEDGTKTRVKGYLGELVNKRLHAMVNNRHGESMQKFDLETISIDALFRKKKSYLKAVVYDDGRKYTVDDAYSHLKSTGFALARTFQSAKCRDACRAAITGIMRHEWKTQEDYRNNMIALWNDFQTWSIEDISKRMSIRKDQYESHVLALDPLPVFAKRTLPQYRAAAWHNWQLQQRGLDAIEQPIDDGFECFYEDIYGNHFAYRIFELPDWHPEPNKVMQFYKLIGNIVRDVAMFYGIVCDLPIQ